MSRPTIAGCEWHDRGQFTSALRDAYASHRDSDGKTDCFVDNHEVKKALELHGVTSTARQLIHPRRPRSECVGNKDFHFAQFLSDTTACDGASRVPRRLND